MIELDLELDLFECKIKMSNESLPTIKEVMMDKFMNLIEFVVPVRNGFRVSHITMDQLRAEIKKGYTLSHVAEACFLTSEVFAKLIMRSKSGTWKTLVKVPYVPPLKLLPMNDAEDMYDVGHMKVVKNVDTLDGLLKHTSVMGVVPFTNCLDEAPDKFKVKIFSRFAFDIEIDDKYEELDWPSFKAPITYLSFSDGASVRVVLVNSKYSGSYSKRSMDGVSIEYVKGSSNMVKRFFELIEVYKPQILLSWNGFTFDVPVLMAHSPPSYEDRFMELSAKSFDGWTFSFDWGVHIDLYRMMDKNSRRAFSSLSLKNVSRELGLDEKLPMPASSSSVEAFIAYNIRDSDLVVAIDERMDVSKGMLSNAALSRSSWLSMVKNATAASVSTMFAYLARLRGKRLHFHEGGFKYETSCKKYSGALVLDPIKGMHKGTIVCVDVNSLYPSIMIGTNIGPNTSYTFQHYSLLPVVGLLAKKAKDKTPIVGKPYVSDKFMYVVVNEDGLMVKTVRSSVFKGEMSEMVSYLTSSRDMIRSRMKLMNEDSDDYRTAYWIQWALKTMTVSVYGALGSKTSWISNRSLAELVTSVGRYCLTRAVDFFSTKGVDVIYGDTDSLYLKFDMDVAEALIACSSLCRDYSTIMYLESGLSTIKFKIEKVARSCIMVKKKKYAMYAASVENVKSYEDLRSLKYKTSIVGLSTIRKDFPLALRALCKDLIDHMLSDEVVNDDTIKSKVENFWQDIAKGAIPVKDLCKEVRDQMGVSMVYTLVSGKTMHMDEDTTASMVSRVWLAETAGKLMDPILSMCKLKPMATYAPMEKTETKLLPMRLF